MKKLMIDMDNCITDAYFMERINDFLGTNYKLEDQEDFYLQNLAGDRKTEFWKYMENRSFYGKDCPLIEGAYEALERLNQKYELYIVTNYIYKNSDPDISGNNLRDKYYYLREKLPFISPEQYIFMPNKNLIHWDITIDDREDNMRNADTKILMSAWHNKKLSEEELKEKGIVRVYSWQDILEILDK